MRQGAGERYGAEKLAELCKLLPDAEEVLQGFLPWNSKAVHPQLSFFLCVSITKSTNQQYKSTNSINKINFWSTFIFVNVLELKLDIYLQHIPFIVLQLEKFLICAISNFSTKYVIQS